MGFSVAEGPDVESDYYNFTALNIHKNIPLAKSMILFTQMLMRQAIVLFCARKHHLCKFEQWRPVSHLSASLHRDAHIALTMMRPIRQCSIKGEGLVIGTDIHMGHLKGCLIEFCKAFFGVDELPVRFRPSFFPFTEPSAEVDIGCSRKDGGLKIGAGDDWLEILGSGMVHPKVLANCGYDPEKVQDLPLVWGLNAWQC